MNADYYLYTSRDDNAQATAVYDSMAKAKAAAEKKATKLKREIYVVRKGDDGSVTEVFVAVPVA